MFNHIDVGGSLPATSRRRTREKVFIGEPAEGSLLKPAKQNDPQTCFNTWGDVWFGVLWPPARAFPSHTQHALPHAHWMTNEPWHRNH
ncbi:hypothetical protein H5410_039375 [Solanum commersonii]|uniref:Uncharacterized protein n=1 Tax=Solanum commersonii TaxID=4109 RepID=A0A9J5YE68_SOLCO|nr:hypothetical protein H5410_039375 [Solanum commersonii]